MSKAYDRVEWDYLKAVLGAMGFNSKCINILVECVTSVSYSFKINDVSVGKVLPSRGLRQGDPLSPYMFVICTHGLSSIINYKASQKVLQGVKIARESPPITHLFFADDSLIFFKANKWNCRSIKNYLLLYEKASGQLINYDKSSITFSRNTPPNHIQYIKEVLQLSVCYGHELYLGLPTFLVCSKRFQFGYIRDGQED